MKKWKNGKMRPGPKGGNEGAYFLGMIGAAVYYLHTTTGFWPSVVALLKAVVWPAFLVYHLLGL
jgi:hypothetical protein